MIVQIKPRTIDGFPFTTSVACIFTNLIYMQNMMLYTHIFHVFIKKRSIIIVCIKAGLELILKPGKVN